MEVYLDLLMVLNFLVDHLLLVGTNRLSGFPWGGKRAAAAAALGALYSGSCLVPGFRFLGNLLWRLVCLGLMGAVAFGWNPGALRRIGIFALLSLAMGGLAVGLNRTDLPGLLLCGGLVWLLCRLSFGGQHRDYVPLQIRWDGREVRLLALRDTGNTLRDPVTAKPVLVISRQAAAQLTGLTEEELKDPLQTLLRHPLPGLRLIPYRTVGQPGGLLLAMEFADVKLGHRRQSALVAFDTGGLGKGDIHQALTGGSI